MLTMPLGRTTLKLQYMNKGIVEAEFDTEDMETIAMCKAQINEGCEHPEKLKGKPGECSPEQIKECYGDVKEHPCVEGEEVSEVYLEEHSCKTILN